MYGLKKKRIFFKIDVKKKKPTFFSNITKHTNQTNHINHRLTILPHIHTFHTYPSIYYIDFFKKVSFYIYDYKTTILNQKLLKKKKGKRKKKEKRKKRR
jgi:hypothetical protein